MIKKVMLGGNLFYYAINKKNTHRLLDQALENNINAIDTANVYSNGNSEKYIGEYLERKKNRSKWVLASKLGVAAGWKTELPGDYLATKKNIFKEIDKSLKRLKTDYIDIYQIHHYDRFTPIEETLEAINKIQKDGKIINFGVSNYNKLQINSYLKKSKKKKNIFSNQIELNLLNHQNFSDYEYQSKVNLIAYGVFSQGLISDKYLNKKINLSYRAKRSTKIRSGINNNLSKKLKILNNFAIEKGSTLGELALNFTMCQKNLLYSIVGIRTEKQLFAVQNYKNLKLKNTEWKKLLYKLNNKNEKIYNIRKI
jgi:aryl-alcohol dehydrogenase-like predicted oxidoreductase